MPSQVSAPVKKPRSAAYACVILGNVIWGFTYLFTRVAQREVLPDVLLAVRFLIAFLLMNLMILLGKGRVSFRGKDPLPILLFVVSEVAYFYFESYGILYTNSTIAGVVLAVVPVVSIGLAILFLREYPTRRQALFCVVPVVGVILMVLAGSTLGVVQPIGVLFLAGACLSSAFYKIANRKSAQQFTAFERTYVVIGGSGLVFTLVALFVHRGQPQVWLAPFRHPLALGCILALSVLGSVTANILVNYAAGILSVVKVSTFAALTTLVSMLAGVFLLHEPMSLMGVIGAALIIVGIWQVSVQNDSGQKQ